MGDSEKSGIQVIARAAQVLRALEAEQDGLSLGEIATRIGLPRSTVQRIVAALVAEQLLTAASNKGGFRLGPALIQLGMAADVGTVRLVRPIMLELAQQTDETVDLSRLDGDGAVFVEQVQGTQRLAAISAVGMAFPLHCTANGKALLAILPAEQRRQLTSRPLKRHTRNTIADRAALEREIGEIVKTGIAFDVEEHSLGICAIGMAFRDALGKEYSLSIPVPTARFETQRARLVKLLRASTAEITGRLVAV